MPVALLKTIDLTIGYYTGRRTQRVVAEHVAVRLHPGELVCLLGPNGAGKSTLLRTLAGMQPPLQGRVELLGADLHRLQPCELARRLSVVLTERTDAGALSARTLVALGRYPYTDWSGRLTPTDETSIDRALMAVGALALAERPVGELSDGERQKVMIARALAQEPMLLLLDEPTAFLDLPRRVEIMGLLRRLARTTGRAVLLSTHDLDLALRSADRLWLLPLGGGLLQAGVPEELVLAGAFQTVFHSAGVEFDPHTGAFHFQQPRVGLVELNGEGLAALWTRRALERLGYAVNVDGERQPVVRITVLDRQVPDRWRIERGEDSCGCRTLAELLDSLNNWIPVSPH